MILSIFKKNQLITIMLASLLASCSHEKKILPPNLLAQDKATVAKYDMGPELVSKIFVDKTKEYGLQGVEGVNLYAVDVDHDGHTDLVVLDDTYAIPKFYFFNPKLKKFVLGKSPFDTIVRANYLNFVDLNHDGIYDVIVGTLNQKTEMSQSPARIFKGEVSNGVLHYSEQSPLPTPALPTASIVALDFNLDGEIDLFLSNWFSYKDQNPKPTPDNLLKGSGFKFEESSFSLHGESDYNKTDKIYINAAPTFGASVCDIDKNGFPDILTNSSNGYFNKLWMNLDGKNFSNLAKESSYAADDDGSEQTHGGGNSFFSLCGDYNNDGLIDIVVGNLSKDSDPESRDKSSVLTGATKSFPPKFIRTEILHEGKNAKWSEGFRRGVWIDYNLDGLSDFILDNSGFPPESRLLFYEQLKDHAFDDYAKNLGVNIVNPSGTVTIDLNQDGVMDFITGQSKTRAGQASNRIYVFENQTKRNGRGSVRFHLQGKKSNYHGISSSVYLTTNKTTRFFNVEYNSGSLPSQNEEGAYFAFDKEIPQNVLVRWAYANKDHLERSTPLVKKYKLSKFKLSGSHHELNLCEDGRVLPKEKNCY